jgi:simple sugar transport system permease protein
MIERNRTAGMISGTLLSQNNIRLLAVLAAVFGLACVFNPQIFLSFNNLQSMCKQLPEYGVMSIAMALAMISGGIDLSLVANANLTAIFAATILKMQPMGSDAGNILLACLVALCCGMVFGAMNGSLIAFFGIPPMLATLGMQQLLRGVSVVITSGRAVSSLPLAFSKLGNSNLFGKIPYLFILFLIVAVMIALVLNKTKYGTRLYMMGTNPVAARYAGINNAAVTVRTYAIAGLLAAVTGLIFTVRFNSAKPDNGISYTLQCILVAVLGGVNPKGGHGTIGGVVLAVFILQVLSSALNTFENLSSFYRDLLWGGALILTLIVNYTLDNRNERKLIASLK